MRQPFFSYLQALYEALDKCSALLIIGYGFSDYHVNVGIREFFRSRSDAPLYIVDYDKNEDPMAYLHRFSYVTSRVIRKEDWSAYYPAEVHDFPGWQRISGDTVAEEAIPPIALWMSGFKSFCKSVVRIGLPPVEKIGDALS